MKEQQIKANAFLNLYQFTYIHLADCLREQNPNCELADNIINFLTALQSVLMDQSSFFSIGINFDDAQAWGKHQHDVFAKQTSKKFSKYDQGKILKSFNFLTENKFISTLQLKAVDNDRWAPFPIGYRLNYNPDPKNFYSIQYADSYPCFRRFCEIYDEKRSNKIKFGKDIQSLFFMKPRLEMFELIQQKKITTLRETILYVYDCLNKGIKGTRTEEILKNDFYIRLSVFQNTEAELMKSLGIIDLVNLTLEYSGILSLGLGKS